jgi:hypothetical protein
MNTLVEQCLTNATTQLLEGYWLLIQNNPAASSANEGLEGALNAKTLDANTLSIYCRGKHSRHTK